MERTQLFDGAKLQRQRFGNGLSQTALSAKTGVSQNHISQIEAGIRQPSAEVAERLAAGVGCEIADLMHDQAVGA